MRLSLLQKYILKQCLTSKTGRIKRKRLGLFYQKIKDAPQDALQTNIITRSIERLIDRELLVGFGKRTKQKWFIEEVKLTSKGKAGAKKLLGLQMSLPFKK